MALIKCGECGKEVSDRAKTCPNCGDVIGNQEVGVAISKTTGTITYSTCRIYRINGSEKIEIGKCKPGEIIYFTCKETMQVQFEMHNKKILQEVKPR